MSIYKIFFNLFINDLFQIIRPNLAIKQWYLPSQDDRNKILGNVKEIENSLSYSIGHQTKKFKNFEKVIMKEITRQINHMIKNINIFKIASKVESLILNILLNQDFIIFNTPIITHEYARI